MSRYDYKDPGVDPEYCNGYGRVRTSRYPDGVRCHYCGSDMPPVMSSHPMCLHCVERHLAKLTRDQKAGAA